VLIDGSIVQAATPQRLFREPHDLRVARFLQLENLYAATSIEGTCCRLGDLELELAVAPAITNTAWIAFAAGDVMIVHEGDDVGTSNCLAGSIATFEQRHDHSRVKVAVEGSDVVIECDVTARDRLRLGSTLVPGAAVRVYIPPTAIAVLPEAT
jgi:ABC-type sulfate/molybdate transport systems ATPase subunit